MATDSKQDAITAARSFHISDPELKDPYPILKDMREQCPVAHSELYDGFYLVTKYEDQHTVFKDPFTYASSVRFIPPIDDPVGEYIPLQIAPPALQGYRAAFAPFFSPAAAERLEDSTRARARSMLRAFVSRGSGDFVEQFCVPFPVVTMLLHMGLPLEDMDLLLGFKNAMVRDGLSHDPEIIARVARVHIPEMVKYYNRILDEREAEADPEPNILTGLVQAKFRERPFTRDEMIRSIHVFIAAGLDTVTSILSISVFYLATHPDKRRQLRENPELIPSAVEELLRWIGAVTVSREVTKDTELGGVHLKAGDRLMLHTASANRDEDEFPKADEVDFARAPNRHLGFGAGPHRCIGSHIARMELRLVLEEMNDLMPNYEVSDLAAVERHWGGIFAIDRLPLLVTPS